MSRSFVTLFLILAISTTAVLSQTGGPRLCRTNEMWSACNGHCPPTCANPIPACPRICVPGCICRPGFLANRNGICVPKGCCDWDEETS